MFDKPINKLSRLKASFVRNGYGPSIVRRIVEETAAEKHFPDVTAETFTAAKEAFKNGSPTEQQMKESIFPIYDAFIRKTDPTADKTHKFTAWICRAYLHAAQHGKPIRAEDLYKIAGDLKDFEAFSSVIPVEKRDINIYASYDDLLDVLRPHQQKRDQKTELRGRLSAVAKKQAVIFYDGPEGKIVMPLTKEACQLWGRNTRWCIAATEENNAFDDYNASGPIFILLPKINSEAKAKHPKYTSFKFALVHGHMWDERDKVISPHIWQTQDYRTAISEKPDFLAGALIKAAREKLAPIYFNFILHFGAQLDVQGVVPPATKRTIQNWLNDLKNPKFKKGEQPFTDSEHIKDFALIQKAIEAVELLDSYGNLIENYRTPIAKIDLDGFKEDFPDLFKGTEEDLKTWANLEFFFHR